MNKAEKILEKFARKNMIQWNQESFKRTHSRLHKSIIEAINEAMNKDKNLSEIKVLPDCLQELWEIRPMLARKAENDYISLKKQLMLGAVVGRKEQLRAFKQFLQSEYHLPISNRMIDEFEQKQSF